MQIEVKDIDEANYLLNVLDTYVKANGIAAAGRAMIFVSRIQEAAKGFTPPIPVEPLPPE